MDLYEKIKTGRLWVHQYSPPEWRFWHQTEKIGPIHPVCGQCWTWVGCRTERYGQIYVGGKGWRAHRFSWFMHFGEIPAGQCVLHRCDNTFCVNPAHLFLGTQLDNIRDKVAKGRSSRMLEWRNPKTKLSDEEVAEIRHRYKCRCKTNGRKPLAAEFKVSVSLIDQIIGRRTRCHS